MGFFVPLKFFLTPSFPVKGCKYWPLLGTNVHWSVRVSSMANSCDSGHSYIMVISDDQLHSSCCRAFDNWAVTNSLYDLGLLRLGFEHPIFHMQGGCSNRLDRRRGFEALWKDNIFSFFVSFSMYALIWAQRSNKLLWSHVVCCLPVCEHVKYLCFSAESLDHFKKTWKYSVKHLWVKEIRAYPNKFKNLSLIYI